jgi:hypothetical protein
MRKTPMTVDDVKRKKLPLKQSSVLGLLISVILSTASKPLRISIRARAPVTGGLNNRRWASKPWDTGREMGV